MVLPDSGRVEGLTVEVYMSKVTVIGFVTGKRTISKSPWGRVGTSFSYRRVIDSWRTHVRGPSNATPSVTPFSF